MWYLFYYGAIKKVRHSENRIFCCLDFPLHEQDIELCELWPIRCVKSVRIRRSFLLISAYIITIFTRFSFLPLRHSVRVNLWLIFITNFIMTVFLFFKFLLVGLQFWSNITWYTVHVRSVSEKVLCSLFRLAGSHTVVVDNDL